MIRASKLRGKPVICGEKQLGLMQNLCYDDALKRVHALIVSCGFRGKRVVLAENVIALGERFVLVACAEKYRRSMERYACSFVRDASGLLVGRIVDHAVDEHSLEVQALNMRTGYRILGDRASYWLLSFHRADPASPDIRIPTDMSKEWIGFGEELDSCDYRP